MRAEIDVRRDEEGRLVGEIGTVGEAPRAFIGVLELVGLIERSLGVEEAEKRAAKPDEGRR
jgi:hypothetical protein